MDINGSVLNPIATEAAWLVEDRIIGKGEWALTRRGNLVSARIGLDGTQHYSELTDNITFSAGNDYKGAVTDPAFNPGIPDSPVYYSAVPGVYANFKDENNAAITINATSGSNSTISAMLAWNGEHWSKQEFYAPTPVGGGPGGGGSDPAVYGTIVISASKNLFDKSQINNTQFIDSGGGINSANSFNMSPPVDVTGLSTVTVSGLPVINGVNFYSFIQADGITPVAGQHGTYNNVPFTLGVPAGAKYLLFNVGYAQSVPDQSYFNTIQVESGGAASSYAAYVAGQVAINKINGKSLVAIGAGASTVSPVKGKKIVVLGDSIPQAGLVTAAVVALVGCTIDNLAQSGTGFVQGGSLSIFNVAQNAKNENGDVYLLAGGTNDWGNNQPLGAIGAYNNNTQFASALYNTLLQLKTDKPLIPIVICTPTQRAYGSANPPEVRNSVNANGNTLRDFCDIIVKIAAMFSARVVDLNAISGITYENRATYTQDGLHPNAAGAALWAGPVADTLNKLVF